RRLTGDEANMKNRQKNWNPLDKEPVKKKKEYEMPDEYKDYLQKLTELIDEKDELRRVLPTLLPEKRAEVLPHIRALEKAVEEFEQKMADEYEDYQKREARVEEAEKAAEEAHDILDEHLQRGFIFAKHTLPPETFKPFEEKVMKDWSEEDRAE